MTGEGPVPSPCINVCRMDPRSGLCSGCGRTLDEIAAWASMSEERKREVWRRLVAWEEAQGGVRPLIRKET